MCPRLQPYVLAPATVSGLGLVCLKQTREHIGLQAWGCRPTPTPTPTPNPNPNPTPTPNPEQEREQGWSLVSESERTLKPSGQLEATLVQATLLYVVC